MSGINWINIIPSDFSFGGTGKTLGHYYSIAYGLIIAPVVILLLVAIVYNVFVGIATSWMYKHAWKKGTFSTVNRTRNLLLDSVDDNVTNVPIAPGLPTTAWEEIFTVNVKIANYLFGGVDIKELGGYLVLSIHDYIVYMPLAIIFIQACELAVAMVLVVLYVDFFVLQVTHSCDSAHLNVDCYDSTDFNMSSLPLDCENTPDNVTKFTCFHLSFNPIIAAAVVGGFLKVTPHLLFTSMTYTYIKMLRFTRYFQCNAKINLISHIAVAIIAECLFIGGGITALVLLLEVDSLHAITFEQADPMRQMTIIFCFLFYFLASSLIWCIYPLTETAVRFQSGVWKQKVISKRSTRSKSPLRPWIVVDSSLKTEDEKLLTDEDD